MSSRFQDLTSKTWVNIVSSFSVYVEGWLTNGHSSGGNVLVNTHRKCLSLMSDNIEKVSVGKTLQFDQYVCFVITKIRVEQCEHWTATIVGRCKWVTGTQRAGQLVTEMTSRVWRQSVRSASAAEGRPLVIHRQAVLQFSRLLITVLLYLSIYDDGVQFSTLTFLPILRWN